MKEKDYSLLRPFDLEDAKAGAFVVTLLEKDILCSLIAGLDNRGFVVIDNPSHGFAIYRPYNLRMAPLCWVEGKPVYKGDILYSKDSKCPYVVDYVKENLCCAEAIYSGDGWNYPRNFTWNSPKTKREGWVNLYKEFGGTVCCGEVFATKDKAESAYGGKASRVDLIRIEWEE